ncbi:hypothetical protein JTB14_001538 [Gonioctena quinquepunctata]|nr:hypothetical protein JTB14_001538 [Gonioctena quinquepunctata]
MSKPMNVFKTLEEAAEYLYSNEIEADILALPPKVDDLTDEEVINDEDLDVLVVVDVAGQMEIDLPSDDDSYDNIPLSNFARQAPSTSQQESLRSTDNKKKLLENKKMPQKRKYQNGRKLIHNLISWKIPIRQKNYLPNCYILYLAQACWRFFSFFLLRKCIKKLWTKQFDMQLNKKIN